MRKLILLALAALFPMVLPAQGAYTPTTAWPYLYPDFTDGVIYMNDGSKTAGKLNVHLRAGKLHYLDGDIVKEALPDGINAIFIGEDKYIMVNREAMKVRAEDRKGCVVTEILGDFASLNSASGAYGASGTTLATRKLSSIDTDSQINQSHMLLLASKHDGAVLPLLEKYFIVTPAVTCLATKGAVEEAAGSGRAAEWKTWLKSHKVKWRDPESLMQVVEFL